MKKRHSELGITSLCISIFSSLGGFLVYIFSPEMNITTSLILPDNYSLPLLLINLFTLGLGVAGIVQKNRIKDFPILGISASIFFIIIFILSLFVEFVFSRMGQL